MLAATRIRVEWTALLLGVALAGLAVVGWQVDGGVDGASGSRVPRDGPVARICRGPTPRARSSRALRPTASEERARDAR